MTTAASAPPPDEPARRSVTRLASILLDGVLTLAAVGGALCAVLVVLTLVFDVGLTLVRPGSMNPAIPENSVAVVREVSPSAVGAGDVVTVDRAGSLPVVHRVTSVESLYNGQWQLTLQGEANPAPAPDAYTVSTVRIVLFSVPGLARPIAALGSPYVLGGIMLAVAAVASWALWPRKSRDHESPAQSSADAQPASGPGPLSG